MDVLSSNSNKSLRIKMVPFRFKVTSLNFNQNKSKSELIQNDINAKTTFFWINTCLNIVQKLVDDMLEFFFGVEFVLMSVMLGVVVNRIATCWILIHKSIVHRRQIAVNVHADEMQKWVHLKAILHGCCVQWWHYRNENCKDKVVSWTDC